LLFHLPDIENLVESCVKQANLVEIGDVDEFDLPMLRAPADDGRMSIQRLSDAVGLSPSPVARRLTRLEDAGFI